MSEEAFEVAYTVRIPNSRRLLEVRKSANAWWMDPIKLDRLIFAFRIDASIRQACAYANISIKQYKYFQSLHPEISEIKELCEAALTLTALRTIAQNLDKVRVARWYLERKRPEEFGPLSHRKIRVQECDKCGNSVILSAKIGEKEMDLQQISPELYKKLRSQALGY